MFAKEPNKGSTAKASVSFVSALWRGNCINSNSRTESCAPALNGPQIVHSPPLTFQFVDYLQEFRCDRRVLRSYVVLIRRREWTVVLHLKQIRVSFAQNLDDQLFSFLFVRPFGSSLIEEEYGEFLAEAKEFRLAFGLLNLFFKSLKFEA